MRKVVQVNGKNIYVYRKGHEKKHLGRTFVKYWKDGKVQLPSDGNHRLQVDKTGKIRVFTNPSLDRRRIPHRILGLSRQIHRKNYLDIKNTLKEKMPHLLEDPFYKMFPLLIMSTPPSINCEKRRFMCIQTLNMYYFGVKIMRML